MFWLVNDYPCSTDTNIPSQWNLVLVTRRQGLKCIHPSSVLASLDTCRIQKPLITSSIFWWRRRHPELSSRGESGEELASRRLCQLHLPIPTHPSPDSCPDLNFWVWWWSSGRKEVRFNSTECCWGGWEQSWAGWWEKGCALCLSCTWKLEDRREKRKNRSSPSLSLLPCLAVMSGWQSHSVPHSQALDCLVLPRTELRGKEANLRVSPWSQGEVGADLDRSSSDGELPEAGCGDSAPAMSYREGENEGRKGSERTWGVSLKSKASRYDARGCSSPWCTVALAELIIWKQETQSFLCQLKERKQVMSAQPYPFHETSLAYPSNDSYLIQSKPDSCLVFIPYRVQLYLIWDLYSGRL